MSFLNFGFPLSAALLGWLVHKLFIHWYFFPQLKKQKASIAKSLGSYAAQSFSFDELKEKIVSKKNIDKLMPGIEGHIDEFLRHKLGQAMPMISMFIGDKTINQLKGIFMSELEEILPQTLKSYTDNLKSEIDIAKIVEQKIDRVSGDEMIMAVKSIPGNPLLKFEILGAMTGLVIGLLQLLMVWLAS